MNSAEKSEKQEQPVSLQTQSKTIQGLTKKKAVECAKAYNALTCLLFGIESEKQWAEVRGVQKWHVQEGTKLIICEPNFSEA